MRVESDHPAAKGGWLHPRDSAQLRPIPKRTQPISDAELRLRWEPIVRAAHIAHRGDLAKLAATLGVSAMSLNVLRVGFAQDVTRTAYWTFPERNAKGWIVGINRRFVGLVNGRKRLYVKGSRPGLTFCDAWDKYPGTIWIVEGASDVAAALSLGICAVGRPSNTGGVEYLAQLLEPYGKRQIVVLGENDRKNMVGADPPHDPKCRCCNRCWPGKSGSVRVARTLAHILKRQIGSRLPPAGHKDLRDYLNSVADSDRQLVAVAIRGGKFPIR